MPGGDHGEIESFRKRRVIDRKRHAGGGRGNIGDGGRRVDLNLKSPPLSFLDNRLETVAKILAQQNTGQKLSVMQGGFINLKARQMGFTLALKPVEVGHKKGRDFNAGNVGQHQARVIVVVVGHSHASFVCLFKNGDRERRRVLKKRIKGVNPCRAGADNGDFLHRQSSCFFSIRKA